MDSETGVCKKQEAFEDYSGNLTQDDLKEMAIDFIDAKEYGHRLITDSKEFDEWLRHRWEEWNEKDN